MIDGLSMSRTHIPANEDFLLLSPTVQAHAYMNVDRMFATRTIKRGQHTMEIPRGKELALRYSSEGKERSVSDYIDRANVAGLLVIKDGEAVLEYYALGLTESARWSSMSMVKSLTSTLVGAALQDGAIGSIDDNVSDYLPVLRGSAYDSVTMRHLITMSSGVRWSEVYTDRNSDVNRYSKSLGDKIPGGVLELMKSLPAEKTPGSHFNYNSGDTYLLGSLISVSTGRTLADYMSEKIWSRLGMEFDAFYTLESEGGQEIGGSRAGIALRDFGRFGMLILQNGVVHGTRILPPGWIETAGKVIFPVPPEYNVFGLVGYGYSWWIEADGAMVAQGFAGQSLYINRQKTLVIVTLSCQPQPPYAVGYGVDIAAERRAFHNAIAA